jgi:hypothetical protein
MDLIRGQWPLLRRGFLGVAVGAEAVFVQQAVPIRAMEY